MLSQLCVSLAKQNLPNQTLYFLREGVLCVLFNSYLILVHPRIMCMVYVKLMLQVLVT